MFAVIETGGKQYKVKAGQRLRIETISGSAGEKVQFNQVLLVGKSDSDIVVGKPHVAGASVAATIEHHGRHQKINIIKFRRRKHHMKRMGHRQNYTEVRIEAIQA